MDLLNQSKGYISFNITKGLNNLADTITSVKRYLLETSDGGVTWTTINNNTNAAFINFINTRVGYCLEDTSKDLEVTTYTLAKTLNGGVNWSNINFQANNVWSLQAVSQNVLFIIAGKPPMGEADVGKVKIYCSVDGGGNWVQVNTPPIYHFQALSAMYWLSATEGYVMYTENSGAGYTSPKTLYYTCNGGASWTIKSRSADPAGNTNVTVGKISGAGQGMGSMYFFPDGVGYYNSYGESIFRTTNGGSDFSSVNPLKEVGERITDFDMINKNIGYAYMRGTSSVYDTTNGGISWKVITTAEKIAARLSEPVP